MLDKKIIIAAVATASGVVALTLIVTLSVVLTNNGEDPRSSFGMNEDSMSSMSSFSSSSLSSSSYSPYSPSLSSSSPYSPSQSSSSSSSSTSEIHFISVHESSDTPDTPSESSSSSSSSIPEEPGLIRHNPYMTNEMDSFEILSTTKFSGKKPDLWKMKYDKYPYWQCGLTFTDEERNNTIDENMEYMKNLLKYAADGTLGRMPPELGGERQFEAEGVNWEADRLKVRYGLFGEIKGQRAVAWAFPGEIVTVEFPEGMDYSGVILSIGKCNHNPSDQWLNFKNWGNNRMPIDSIGFDLGSNESEPYIVDNTVKIGSPFGGMVYLRLDRTFSSTLYINFTNVGRAPIIIYNRTTNEEWNRELRNAPGNVAEIRTPGNRFVFTARQIRDIEDIQYVADYWFKAIAASESTVGLVGMPITMHFDERVDAGAAVSYVGRWFTQHPSDWARGCVQRDVLLNTADAWGPIHEMNHQMQGWNAGGCWGISDPTEETNNALTTINYMLYTNVAGQRHNGLSGWAWVSDGYSTMRPIFNGNYDQNHLKSYVSILHGFGSDTFIKFIKGYYSMWSAKNYADIYNITRDSESAFCLIAADTVEIDTRYFCSLFGYTIVPNVAEAIKNMNYPSFYPFFNLYAMTYNGNRYGRPYKLPYGITTRLNFTATTAIDPKATEVKYTIKSGLSKGTLVKVEENVYDYTPTFNPDDNDTFVLHIDCKVNGEKVHIEQEGMFYVTPHIIMYDTYKNITAKNLEEAINVTTWMAPTVTNQATTFLGISQYNDGSTKSLSVVRGRVAFPETGYYTLFMRPDDMGRFLLKTSDDYEQLIEFTSYIGSYSRTNNKTFYTLKLEKDKEYPFILYNFNTGGPGEIRMGYCYHGEGEGSVNVSTCSVSDIKSAFLYHDNSPSGVKEPEFVVPEIVYTRPTRFLIDDYRSTPKCVNENESCFITCNDLPTPEPVEPGGRCVDIFDDSTGTFHHTPWKSSTKFPVNFSFSFAENITFNKVYMHHRKGIDSWGYFEMYARSLETGAMELVHSYHHPEETETNIVFPEFIKTDRVDFKVYNNTGGRNYIVTSEIAFLVHGDTYTKYTNSFGTDIESSGFRNVAAGGASGGYITENEKAGEGSLCFKMKGAKFGLYGFRKPSSGKFRITIDGEEVERGSQSYFYESERTAFFNHEFEGAEAKEVHHVCMEVVEGYVNLDVIGWD